MRTAREDDLLAVAPHTQEEIAHSLEGSDTRKVISLPVLGAVCDKLRPERGALIVRKQRSDDLIAALADLTADEVEGEVLSKVIERLLPRLRMQADCIDERSVDIADDTDDIHVIRKGQEAGRNAMESA